MAFPEIIAEKTTSEIARNVVEAIARLHTTIFQNVYYHFGLITEDIDDNKFVDCAVAADAEYVVTNDHHFDVLRSISWPHVQIIAIKDFVTQL